MPAPWVEASRPPRVPGTNAHASAMTPIIFVIFNALSLVTWLIVLSVVAVVVTLSLKGHQMGWIVRRAKSRLRGARVSARPLFYRRRVIKSRSHSEVDMSVFRKVD